MNVEHLHALNIYLTNYGQFTQLSIKCKEVLYMYSPEVSQLLAGGKKNK